MKQNSSLLIFLLDPYARERVKFLNFFVSLLDLPSERVEWQPDSRDSPDYLVALSCFVVNPPNPIRARLDLLLTLIKLRPWKDLVMKEHERRLKEFAKTWVKKHENKK